jgi:hypothetical protein
MKRFPSKHGTPVVFTPVRSRPPMPSRIVPRSPPPPRNLGEEVERTESKPPRPSYVEIDVVEANLSGDPRYEPHEPE